MSRADGPLDWITEACGRELSGDKDGANWVFTWLDRDDRIRFDLWLVKVDDPLAYEPGTTEQRFKERVRRMVHLQRTGELAV